MFYRSAPGKVFFGIVAFGNSSNYSYIHTRTIINMETGEAQSNTNFTSTDSNRTALTSLQFANVLTVRSAYSGGNYRAWITSPVARTANLTWVNVNTSSYSGTTTLSIPANTETQVFGVEVATNSGRIGNNGYMYGWLS